VAIVKGNVQGKSLTVAESIDNRVTCACRNNIRKKNSSKLRYDLVGDEECQATVCRMTRSKVKVTHRCTKVAKMTDF